MQEYQGNVYFHFLNKFQLPPWSRILHCKSQNIVYRIFCLWKTSNICLFTKKWEKLKERLTKQKSSVRSFAKRKRDVDVMLETNVWFYFDSAIFTMLFKHPLETKLVEISFWISPNFCFASFSGRVYSHYFSSILLLQYPGPISVS